MSCGGGWTAHSHTSRWVSGRVAIAEDDTKLSLGCDIQECSGDFISDIFWHLTQGCDLWLFGYPEQTMCYIHMCLSKQWAHFTCFVPVHKRKRIVKICHKHISVLVWWKVFKYFIPFSIHKPLIPFTSFSISQSHPVSSAERSECFRTPTRSK